jgi:ABC-type glycerol-3-phosphate transport system permease component
MQNATVKPHVISSRSWNAQKRLGQILLYLLLGAFGIFILFPFYYMIISSLRPAFYNFDQLTLELLPSGFDLSSYLAIFTKKIGFETSIVALTRGLFNTLILEAAIVSISTVLNVLAAYTFAKRTFPGKQFLFTLLSSNNHLTR